MATLRPLVQNVRSLKLDNMTASFKLLKDFSQFGDISFLLVVAESPSVQHEIPLVAGNTSGLQLVFYVDRRTKLQN